MRTQPTSSSARPRSRPKDEAVLAAERTAACEREGPEEEFAAVVRGRSADLERAGKARDADVAQLQRDLVATLHDGRETAQRLEAVLAA